jgi:phospholipid/cholesterol/gamma-HCH transport system substrate-binding protein
MSSAAKVGVFMLVILMLFGYFIIRVEDLSFGREATKQIHVELDSAAGLREKTPVKVAGVDVGTVSSIELLPSGRARVTLEVAESGQLHQDATASIASLGLLGEQYVNLEPGSPGAPPIAEGVTIRGTPTATVDDVTNKVAAIADDVKAITASLRTAVGNDEGARRMEEIVANVHDVSLRLRTILEVNEGNINASAENFRRITDDLRVEIPRIAASIDRVAGSIGGTVGENREDVRVIVENLRTLSADLKTTTDHINSITGQVRSGEGSVGKLIYSDDAHEKLTSALGSIDEGVGELRGMLGRVNKLGLRVGLDGYYLSDVPDAPFDGNSRFTLGASVIPNTDRNFFLQVAGTQDARGDRSEKVVVTTTTPEGGVPTTVTTRQTKWDKEFLISAQVGWEFDDLRVRGGLIDSHGGIGADWQASKRLQVTGEAFDFGSEYADFPRMRLLGRYRVIDETERAPGFFVNSGVEDILNEPAFIFGAGVSWTDDDLKYLLGRVPIPTN